MKQSSGSPTTTKLRSIHCLAPETGFFRTGAALDVSGDQVYFCPRAKHEPRARARRADSVQEDDESEDEGEATTLESRMVIAFKSLADPAQLAVLATTVFFQSSSMTTSRNSFGQINSRMCPF